MVRLYLQQHKNRFSDTAVFQRSDIEESEV